MANDTQTGTIFRDGTSQRFDGSLEPTAFFNIGVGFDF